MIRRRNVFGDGSASRAARALAAALCGAVATARASSLDGVDVEALLEGSRTVRTEEGRTYTGELTGVRDGRLGVLIFDGGGEVEYSLPVEDVAAIRFPGEQVVSIGLELYENARYDEALPILEAVYRQRITALPLLSEAQGEPLAALPRAYWETGDEIDAVATARRLLREIRPAAHRAELEALVLNGYLEMDLYERAAEWARDWCARRGRYPESALGWSVLAEIAHREERHDDALWIALQPIAFSGARPMPHLDRAYAAAIHACRILENDEYGLRLFNEARERGLQWPEDRPGYPETFDHYRELAAAASDGNAADEDPAGPEIDPRPALEDLNLPLHDVRRLLLSLPGD